MASLWRSIATILQLCILHRITISNSDQTLYIDKTILPQLSKSWLSSGRRYDGKWRPNDGWHLVNSQEILYCRFPDGSYELYSLKEMKYPVVEIQSKQL